MQLYPGDRVRVKSTPATHIFGGCTATVKSYNGTSVIYLELDRIPEALEKRYGGSVPKQGWVFLLDELEHL